MREDNWRDRIDWCQSGQRHESDANKQIPVHIIFSDLPTAHLFQPKRFIGYCGLDNARIFVVVLNHAVHETSIAFLCSILACSQTTTLQVSASVGPFAFHFLSTPINRTYTVIICEVDIPDMRWKCTCLCCAYPSWWCMHYNQPGAVLGFSWNSGKNG